MKQIRIGELETNLECVNCSLCGKSDTKLFATTSYRDYLNRRPELKKSDDQICENRELANYKFRLVKCKNCGLVYVNPRLLNKSLAKLYHKEYFSQYINTISEAHKKRTKTFKIEIAELEKLTRTLKIGMKIPDIGCGGGFFLAELDISWKKYGVEINPSAVKYGRTTF